MHLLCFKVVLIITLPLAWFRLPVTQFARDASRCWPDGLAVVVLGGSELHPIISSKHFCSIADTGPSGCQQRPERLVRALHGHGHHHWGIRTPKSSECTQTSLWALSNCRFVNARCFHQVWLPAVKAKGLEISGTFSRRQGHMYMDMTFTNKALQHMTDFAVQFNKNRSVIMRKFCRGMGREI